MQPSDIRLGLVLCLLAILGSIEAAKNKADSAILLSKVKTLTLYGDKQTSHRRVSAIPQLTCIGGNGCKYHRVDLMRCQNAGSEYDAEDIQWTCSASLPPEFKLGSTEVVCEGYDNANDPWVLKGSCGVEYRLLLTDYGENKYLQKETNPTFKPKNEDYSAHGEGSESSQSSIAKFLFWLVFIVILCLILYRIFNPPNPDGRIRLNGNNRPGWGGGGGGGGDDPYDDPPPPYSPRPPSQPRAKPSSSRTATAGSSRNAGPSSGPGFWSGAATGGAAGYGAGYYHASRAAEAERQRERERERERQRSSTSSWFGSGGGSSSGGGFGGGSSSPSSSRHQSTGFGGTRRR